MKKEKEKLNLVYINEKEERKKYKKLTREELINRLLEMEEKLIDAHYESMGEDL